MKFSSILLLFLSNQSISTLAQENKCFEDRDELKRAIDHCYEGDDQSTGATIADYNPDRCENQVKTTYGWPMNTWCVGAVDDFQLLFVGKRSFNEDISGKYDTHYSTVIMDTLN